MYRFLSPGTAMADPLSILERRLLGVLVEKALTAASPEPLTLNAIVIGANQKSNRDPISNLEEPEIDDGLERLQRKALVFRVTGGRTERWRHNLYDAWQVSKAELAILAELLLRGPQTAAEARTRASRMEPIDSEEMTGLIKGLVERGYVVWLTPEGRRGAILTHGFHSPEELNRSTAQAAHRLASDDAQAPSITSHRPVADVSATVERRLNENAEQIVALHEEVRQLRKAVEELQQSLGVVPG